LLTLISLLPFSAVTWEMTFKMIVYTHVEGDMKTENYKIL